MQLMLLQEWEGIDMTKKIKYKAALKLIAYVPDCICGSFSPEMLKYSLPKNKSDEKLHAKNCSGVIAAKALGWIK